MKAPRSAPQSVSPLAPAPGGAAQNGPAVAHGAAAAEAGEQLVEELQQLLVGLRRTGRLAEALAAARDAAADQVKQAIR